MITGKRIVAAVAVFVLILIGQPLRLIRELFDFRSAAQLAVSGDQPGQGSKSVSGAARAVFGQACLASDGGADSQKSDGQKSDGQKSDGQKSDGEKTEQPVSDRDKNIDRERQLPAWIKVCRGLSYVPNGKNKAQTLDLFLPENIKTGALPDKLPLIIFIHGGGWIEGDKTDVHLRPLIKNGFAVASLNYRLSEEATFPAQIYDVKAAVRWLRANSGKYNLDPKHFGVWGTSAGGLLAALLGTTGDTKVLDGSEGNNKESSKVQAVCDYFGPSDLTTILEQATKVNEGKATVPASEPVRKLLGKLPSQDPKKAKLASPITYVTRKCPPFLIAHGDKDNVVPVDQSRELFEALKKKGVDCQLVILPGEGHGRSGFARMGVKGILDFFTRTLKNDRSAAKIHH